MTWTQEKHTLNPQDVIVIKGNIPDETLQQIAEETKAFVILLEEGQTFETMTPEELKALVTYHEAHEREKSRDTGT